MNADYSYDITDLELVVSKDGSIFMIRAQVVDQPPSGPRRSGKYIHLTMTAKHAMNLLPMLQNAQKQHGLKAGGPVTTLDVPGKRDLN